MYIYKYLNTYKKYIYIYFFYIYKKTYTWKLPEILILELQVQSTRTVLIFLFRLLEFIYLWSSNQQLYLVEWTDGYRTPINNYLGIQLAQIYPNWKREGNSSKEEKGNQELGNVQGIEASVGTRVGDLRIFHNAGNGIRMRSCNWYEWGGGPVWSHRLRSSAITFCEPGMWLTSISMPSVADNRHIRSKKIDKA